MAENDFMQINKNNDFSNLSKSKENNTQTHFLEKIKRIRNKIKNSRIRKCRRYRSTYGRRKNFN